LSPDRFRLIDHTADVAVVLWGKDPADLLRSGGIALFHLIAGGSPIREVETRHVSARGADLEEILVGWMNRLLLLHEVDGLVLSRFEPSEPTAGGVDGLVAGEPFDAARHRILREVKAVTYHGVKVERDGVGLTARLILDI
jgi:SHS2 domain-containing protein